MGANNLIETLCFGKRQPASRVWVFRWIVSHDDPFLGSDRNCRVSCRDVQPVLAEARATARLGV
jgi:hypothetical protein